MGFGFRGRRIWDTTKVKPPGKWALRVLSSQPKPSTLTSTPCPLTPSITEKYCVACNLKIKADLWFRGATWNSSALMATRHGIERPGSSSDLKAEWNSTSASSFIHKVLQHTNYYGYYGNKVPRYCNVLTTMGFLHKVRQQRFCNECFRVPGFFQLRA